MRFHRFDGTEPVCHDRACLPADRLRHNEDDRIHTHVRTRLEATAPHAAATNEREVHGSTYVGSASLCARACTRMIFGSSNKGLCTESANWISRKVLRGRRSSLDHMERCARTTLTT